ncbi:MAG: CHAT domain-containing protein [Actinomycetota bacterium]|nr:CHAT domain-containing protein [Actinomycetota bacterium]
MALARKYEDFILELREYEPAADTYRIAVLPSPAVGESAAVTVRLNRADVETYLQDLDRKRIDEEDLFLLGEGLADRLLPAGEVRGLFVQALRAAGRDGGVRVRLLVRDPRLAQLPWEYAYLQLHDGERSQSHFLVLNPQVSLVRHEALPEAHPPLGEPLDRPVRFVVATASPTDAPTLRLDKERAVIDAALRAFSVGGAEVEWEPVVEHATPEALRRRLMLGAEVFHFAGHGGFGDQAVDPGTGALIGRGYLVLESDAGGGTSAPFAEGELAAVLQQAGVRLAVLGACRSGRRDGVSAWTGVAPALVQQGVGAVVAMQYDVLDYLAIPFADMFYAAIAAGLSVDEAMAAGRLGMKGKAEPRDFDWGVPVLYMRSPDGVLFPGGRDAAPVADNLRMQIDQVVRTNAAGGVVIGLRGVGAEIRAAVRVRQEVGRNTGTVIGVDLGGRGGDASDPDGPAGPAPPPAVLRPPPSLPPRPVPPPADLPAEPPIVDDLAPDDLPEVPTRWLQAQVSIDGEEVQRAFVAGGAHEVQVSIGRSGSIRADRPFPTTRADALELVVRFVHGSVVQESPLRLPRDTVGESTLAPFTLTVGPGDARVTALVAVYRGATILQAATLRGSVVTDLAAERTYDGEIELVVDPVRDLARPMPSLTEASVLTDGNAAVMTAGRASALSLDVHELFEEARGLVERIQAGADLLAQGEDELERLMVDLAFQGRRLNGSIAELLADDLRSAQRLQIVATDPTAFLPLELIYDGPQPTGRSRLCPTFRSALEAGNCQGCDGGGPDADTTDPRICPLRFWGLSKVIERHASLSGGPTGGVFAVRSERVEGRQRLRALTDAVVGSSARVTGDELAAIVNAARTAFGQAAQVDDWSSWKREVTARSPAILVAVPHHEMDTERDPAVSCLELGRALLPAAGIEVEHVGSGDVLPGPIVVLLGCNTGLDDTPLDSFAGAFRQRGASIVVCTLGELIPDQASGAAQALVTELAAAIRFLDNTLGDALLRVRRALLAKSVVLGLLVVGHGDADWLLPTEV